MYCLGPGSRVESPIQRPLPLSGSRFVGVRSDLTAGIRLCADQTVTGLLGDVDPLPAQRMVQESYVEMGVELKSCFSTFHMALILEYKVMVKAVIWASCQWSKLFFFSVISPITLFRN